MTWLEFTSWIPFLSVCAPFVGYILVMSTNRWQTKKQIMNEAVTKDRKAYRDNLREYAVKFVALCNGRSIDSSGDTKLDCYNRILFILNPEDILEQQLICLMQELLAQYDSAKANQFIYCVMMILKFEWERAKDAAGDKNNKKNLTGWAHAKKTGKLPHPPEWMR
ncbi:MAG: hypothetical protein LBS74_09210 [Oscillospiraceae bacterium]|jgi:hypothetical protein|nr:hypothetical protein [Oscillospiraceae bacterium]